MSIKDLFGKTSRNLEETVQDVESVAFVEEKTKADQTYHPQIDFSDPENFVYYGSAELYYDAAIRRIYEDYPYDGSKAEQIEFEEKASALERWVFENKYPKTTGHIQLGTTGDFGSIVNNIALTGTPEYIRIWGGLHTDSSAINLADHFESSARFDADKNRNQNWNCDFDEGVTIEFWMKKESFDLVNNPYEIVLDLWNGDGPATEKRLVIGASALSGTDSLIASIKDGLTPNSSALIDLTSLTGWNHFAFTFYHENDQVKCDTFVNGDMVGSTTTLQSSRMDFTGKVDGFIGALQTVFNSAGAAYAGKFEGYLDEFRFWKTKRTSRQIKLNWFNAIGGGANTDDATSDLGVYLKFNEGIVGNNATDSVVLDYSGRLANGVWVGYESTTSARSTDSAMESVGYTETPSPIIYKEHSDVSALISEMQTSGSVYDADRGQSFFRSMPTWLQEEDNGNLRFFSQILGSYLDTLHVQIKELTELKTKRYPMEGVKASTMAADLLKDKGFMISNMFESNEVYEKLASVNLQDAQFETELHEIKNIIYTNIYNNLEKIYKTKGTEGSIRNLIRCYGIDDELIKLNLYTDGGTQYLTDKSRETSVKKKYVNFNDPTRFEASIYQVASTLNPNSYIAASADASRNAFTMEADIVVPYKKEVDENGYFNTPFLSASIMGFHEAAANPADFTWGTENLSVYLVRDSLNSRHAKFVMRNIAGTINEESDYIYDIYENEHYNVALRIKPQTYPYAGGVTTTTPSYDIELYAVTTNFGEIENEVLLTTTIANADGLALMNASKRVYAGAHVENFTGAIQQESDLHIGGVRAWLDYLENDEILQHNKDVLNYGMRSSIDGSNLYLIDDVQIPTQELSILNWDFDTVTTTDGTGEFEVEDITSGSTNTIYGAIDDIIRREHKAKGTDFASNDSSIIDYEFIQAYKKQLPESAYDAQNIYIKGEQEINFSDDDDVSDNLFIMEKSPASLISEEMLKSFSTTLEFANLFMRPVERFRVEYKDLARARQLFFERVESDMDFDRFFEYFKWIDSSISSMVNQLIPMSANFAGGIVDVIEPHILERDKYQRQVGLLSTVTSTEASMRGAQELKYNWRVGHAPLSGDENENCLWQKERRDSDLARVVITQNALTASNPIKLSGSAGVYDGRTYATRRLSRPYTLDIGFKHSIHGGINYSPTKNRDALAGLIPPGNANDATGAPENIVIVGAGSGPATNIKPACIDEHKPAEINKYKYDGFAVVGKHAALATQTPTTDSDHYAYRRKISHIWPGNIVSSSVNSGYSSTINRPAADGGLGEGYDLVNLHSDTTDITNVIPVQGPFTQEHVGGRQSRHTHITTAIDPATGYVTSSFDRPEFWNIYVGEFQLDTATGEDVDDDGAIGISSPDYQVGVVPDTDSQKAWLFREERAKRPVNIKNIQTIVGNGAHGNFVYNYEVMSTFGDQGYFLRRADDLLPESISQVLPETTNFATLMAQSAGELGNLQLNSPDGTQSNRFATLAATATFQMITATYVDLDGDNETLTLTSTDGTTRIYRFNFGGTAATGDDLGGGVVRVNNAVVGPPTQAKFAAELKTAIESPAGHNGKIIVTTSTTTNADDTLTFTQATPGSAGNTTMLIAGDSPLSSKFKINGGTDTSSDFTGGVDAANIVPTQDRSTGSANVIRTRFSAPGGPEINSPAYLDVASQQYSVHNSINYRNLTTRITGSGEIDTIRVNSQASRREGLRMLRTRHQGQFGIDSQHGTISATDYVAEGSFHKQHRNTSLVAIRTYNEFGDVVSESSSRHDNDHYHRPLPSSDFRYSWINNAISGADAPDQFILSHAPKNGMIKTDVGYHEAIIFPSASDMRLDDCSQDPIADPFVSWGNTGQFTDDGDFTLSVDQSATTNQITLNFSEIGTLQFSFNNLGCSNASALQSLVENGEPRSFGPSVSLPTLYFNPSNSAILDYATSRSGYVEDQEITLVNVSIDEPTLESEINYLQRTTSNGATSVVTKTTNDIIVLVPFSSTPGAFEVTIAEANQSYHSFSSQNIQCADAYQRLEVDSVFIGNDGTAPPWNNIPTLYYSSGVFTQVDSTVYMCSGYFEDTISNSFSNATTTAPTLVSNVTFYDDDGSGGRATSTAESKETTVVPGSSSPGANQVSEAEANLTTFGYVASSHLADNIDGSLEFELVERDVLAGTSQTFGPQSTVPSSFSQIYYSSNSSDQVILTLTSRSTGTGLIVEDDSTIIFNNATLDNTSLVANATYPNWSYSSSSRTTKTVTADTTITLVSDGTSIGTTQNKINETEANNNLSFSSVGTNMPCGSSATYQIYISINGGTETLHGTDPNNRPNVEYSSGDTIAYRVVASQCTDSFGNPYTDEITITLQDAAEVSLP